MNPIDKYAYYFKKFLPAPFTIAVLLTLLTFVLAFFFASTSTYDFSFAQHLVVSWEGGLWDRDMVVFAFQMILMLVLGHVLAITKPVDELIQFALQFCTNNARSAFLVTLLTVAVALFNWGLGLIFGAIFARKLAEKAKRRNLPLNYPLIGACGYSGLMVWHGGISGSSLVKVAETDHVRNMMSGIYSEAQLAGLPSFIPFSETVFSPTNLFVIGSVLVLLPITMYFLGRFSSSPEFHIEQIEPADQMENDGSFSERMNRSSWLVNIFSTLLFVALCIRVYQAANKTSFSFINPDFINASLLFLGILLHKNFNNFLHAVDQAVKGAAGIIIQFPLYFGIMGLMKGSGLVEDLSSFFVSISNSSTFPLYTYISASIVNIFVPSGGGQWAVQGPIIIHASDMLQASLPKSVLAMAYGDQLTNMLQPFWALPLLGITGLKAKEILPYTLFLMVVGFFIFLSALLFF